MLSRNGISIGDKTVARLLRDRGYSLQGARKTAEGAQHPDRNAQFEYLNTKAQDCMNRGVPFISVDTKKKELVGNFKNAGREWQPEDAPELVDVHDCALKIERDAFHGDWNYVIHPRAEGAH